MKKVLTVLTSIRNYFLGDSGLDEFVQKDRPVPRWVFTTLWFVLGTIALQVSLNGFLFFLYFIVWFIVCVMFGAYWGVYVGREVLGINPDEYY